MNVIARLEYELAYYDSAVHRCNHYTTRTPPIFVEELLLNYLTISRGGMRGFIPFPRQFVRKWTSVIEYTDYISAGSSCPRNDIKPPDGEVPDLENTTSLPFLPAPLWPGQVALDRVVSIGQIEKNMYANEWLMLDCDRYIEILEIILLFAQSAGAVEYTNCFSAEG